MFRHSKRDVFSFPLVFFFPFEAGAFRLWDCIIPDSRRIWSDIPVQLSEVLECMNKLWATRVLWLPSDS